MMGCGELRCSESRGEASVLRAGGKGGEKEKVMRVKFKARKEEDLEEGTGEGEGGILRLCDWILVPFTITERGL